MPVDVWLPELHLYLYLCNPRNLTLTLTLTLTPPRSFVQLGGTASSLGAVI